MKRIMFIVLAVALAAGVTSCDKGKKSDPNTIEIWSIQTEGDGPGTFRRAIDRFNKVNPDIKVNLTVMANDAYKGRLAVAMASNATPDLFLSWSGGPMYEYANNDRILDLTSYMNANNYKERFLDAGIAQASYKGKIWAVPVTNVSVCTVFYNKDIFQSHNLQVPTTIAEFERVCDTLKANGITPFSLANKTQWTGSMYFMFLATRHGGTQPFINAVDGSGTFLDQTFIYAGDKLQEWVNKGYFLPGFNGLDWDSGQARAPLYQNETAMLIMGSWFVSQAQSESPEFFSRMGIFPFPRDQDGVGNAGTVIGTVGDNFYHVSATSKNPDKAFELLTFLMDDTGVQDMVNDGKIPPVKGVLISNPLLAELFAQVQAAPDMQLWYDQSLSPEVADVHKVTSQEIFGGNLSPQQAAQRLQDAQAAYLQEVERLQAAQRK
jgi:raffinose/stachyose/melibiose transport system substrate-binding protein